GACGRRAAGAPGGGSARPARGGGGGPPRGRGIRALPDAGEPGRGGARAREVAEARGDTATRAAVLYFQGSIMMQGTREQHARGLALAEQALALTEREGLTLAGLRLARRLANRSPLDRRFPLARRARNRS